MHVLHNNNKKHFMRVVLYHPMTSAVDFTPLQICYKHSIECYNCYNPDSDWKKYMTRVSNPKVSIDTSSRVLPPHKKPSNDRAEHTRG